VEDRALLSQRGPAAHKKANLMRHPNLSSAWGEAHRSALISAAVTGKIDVPGEVVG
jgi:hypothetical protein